MSRRRTSGRHRPLGGVAGPERVEERRGRAWKVRSLPGHYARKGYVCPRCLQDIPAGTPHVVVWPADESDGVGQRRHWHTHCWARFR